MNDLSDKPMSPKLTPAGTRCLVRRTQSYSGDTHDYVHPLREGTVLEWSPSGKTVKMRWERGETLWQNPEFLGEILPDAPLSSAPNQLKVLRLHPDAKLPTRANPTDAGLDLYAVEPYCLDDHEVVTVKTGISIQLPANHVGLIWPRSGWAAKHGLDTMAGVIDESYRGEICIVLTKHGYGAPFRIKAGDKIAQLLIQPIVYCEAVEVDALDSTERGRNGFGSTGN